MVGLRLGKLFCEYYNETNGTNLSPKDIFTNVVAPVLFKAEQGRHLVNWTNSKFFVWNTKKDGYDINDFGKVLEDFCDGVESYGDIMDTKKVYGGSAVPFSVEYNKQKKRNVYEYMPQSTSFCYAENVYFDIDERYCSWIGSVFTMNVKGWDVAIIDRKYVEMMWDSVNAYRDALDNNSVLKKGNQIGTWNTLYFITCCKDKRDLPNIFRNDKNFKDGTLKSDVTFLNIVMNISKYFNNVKYIDMESFGQQNTTCGSIVLTGLSSIKRTYEAIEKIYGVEVDYETINRITKNQERLREKMVECGAVYDGIFDIKRDIDMKKLKEDNIKVYFEYINTVMDKNHKEIVDAFVEEINKAKANSRNTVKFGFVKDRKKFLDMIGSFTKKNKIDRSEAINNMVGMIIDNGISDDDFNFIISYFNYMNNE